MNAKDSLFNYYEVQRNLVVSMPESADPSGTFRRLLLVALLDSLSGLAFPTRTPRQRFTAFVRRFSNWADCNRVSLPHLKRFLEVNPDPDFEKLRMYVKAQVAKWTIGELVPLDREPSIDLVRPMWPSTIKSAGPWESLKIDSFEHVSLLYESRNSLIHEFKAKGNSPLQGFPDRPYYIHCTVYDFPEPANPSESWDLHYPLSFLSSLVDTSLHRLRAYLEENQIEVAYLLNQTAYWIDEIG